MAVRRVRKGRSGCNITRQSRPWAAIAAAAAAVTAAGVFPGAGRSRAAAATWDGGGDNLFWTHPANWNPDAVPPAGDDLTFGTGPVTIVHLNGNQTANSLAFTQNYTLGAFGTPQTLTNTSGNVTVSAGTLATVNAVLAGANGLSLSGGGTLYLTNPFNAFTGNVGVSGAGTSLLVNPGLPPAPTSRGDAYVLGAPGARTVTLAGGGEVKFIDASYNPDGSTKVFALGTGGGAINVAAGYQQVTFDDGGQFTGAGGLTKRGTGRLTIGGANDYLVGSASNDHVLSAGVLEFSRLLGGSTTAGTRFAAFNAASAITVNGGLLVPNTTAAVGVVDNALTLNAGGALGVQGADHEYGVRTGTATTLSLNGGAILGRDANFPQTARATRVNSLLSGGGTVDIIAGTGAVTPGSNGRVVFQRGDLAHTFNGTFVLRDAAALENRANQGATPNVGKTIGDATVELNGFNALLDLRDNGAGSNGQLTAYLTNDVTVTATQPGGLQRILVTQSNANTGNTFNLRNLTMGGQRLLVTGGSSYALSFNTMSVGGNATLDLVSAPLTLAGTVSPSVTPAVTESVAGGGITKLANSNLTITGAANVSTFDVRHGSVILGGANGAINPGTVSGTGAITVNGVAFANNAPLNQGALLLDNTAATNANRLNDAVGITMLGNGLLRLTSQNVTSVAETTGDVSVPFGFPTFDVVRTGATGVPVLTLGTAALSRGANAAVNFTGTNLGTAGTTARIVLPGQGDSTFLGGWAVSGNEFAKYSTVADNGAPLGVTPMVTADYTAVPNEAALASGVNGRVTANPAAAAPVTLTAARAVNSLNVQGGAAAGASASNVNTNGNLLTVESGGLIAAAQNAAIFGNANGGVTAGTSAAPAQLFVTNNVTLAMNAIVRDNAAGGAVTLVKSGTGSLQLINQGTPAVGAPTYTNAMTGGVVVNAGILNVTRGTYLGVSSNPVTLAGGTLEINQPSLTANAVLPGFGHNVTVVGNAQIGIDDNGFSSAGNGTAEASDTTSQDNNTAPFGSLTISGPHTLNVGGFGGYDVRFTGTSFAGTPTINVGVGREANTMLVLGGAMTGSGFNLIANGSNPGAVLLGAGATDTTDNAGLSTPITLYSGTLRLYKANDVDAIGNGAAAEDVVINGGTLAWGPGHYLTDTANVGVTFANTTTGQNQIADNATVTVLSGSLGVAGQINNETIGTLNLRNGTVNPGLGAMRAGVANLSGGALTMSAGSTFGAGTLNLLSGAPDMTLTVNNYVGGATVLDVGAGGMTVTGQNVNLSAGGTASLASSGGVVNLGGNVIVNGDPLNTNSYQRGIFFTTGRELGNNVVDLQGGTRTFTVDVDSHYTVNAAIANGGLTKAGPGTLVLANYRPSTFAGAVTVNDGVLSVRTPTALGTAAGGTTVNAGGTLRLDNAGAIGDALTLAGAGALIPNGSGVREPGALVVETGTAVLSGAVVLSGDATIATNAYQTPAGIGTPIAYSGLFVEGAGGVTGAGTLTVSGNGEAVVRNGLNTATGGLVKEGRGTLTLAGTGTYPGATVVSAGTLAVRGTGALGTAAGGTSVYGGASLELQDGANVGAEALTLYGAGSGQFHTAALRGVGGTNSVGGAVTLGADAVVRSDVGTLTLGAAVTGAARTLTLNGDADGAVNGTLTVAALNKAGAGTWVLRGAANAVGGPTNVTGGTLVLDFATSPTAKISAADPLNLAGGSVAAQGAAGSQTVGGTNLQSGGATLNLGALARTAGATADVVTATGGAVTTSTPAASGTPAILGAYATANGADWATVSGANVVPFAAYTALSPLANTGTGQSLASGQAQAGAVSTNSLKLAGGPGLFLGANNLTVASGGVLHAGAVDSGVGGTGVLAGASAAAEFVVHVAGPARTLDIGVPVIGSGAGGLTKAGAGTLVLSGSSAFTGDVAVNRGTLAVANTSSGIPELGSGAKNVLVNGGTFAVLTGAYDPSTGTKRYVIGPAGGTLYTGDGQFTLNDPNQLAGTGTLTKTGGARLSVAGDYAAAFTGQVVVDGGSLDVGNVLSLGNRAEQTITVNPDGAFSNGAGTLNHNFVINGGILAARAGDRTFTGTVAFTAPTRVPLVDFDAVQTARSMTFTNRVTGGAALDVFGVANGNALFLSSGANEIGSVNLNANATLEARLAGSIGNGAAPTAVTLAGANSRYLLREYATGTFNSDVTVANQATIDFAQLASSTLPAAGSSGTPNVFLSINDLTVNPSPVNDAPIVTFNGANGFNLRVAGTTTFNASPVVNANGAAGVVLEGGINYTAPAGAVLDKRGSSTVTLLGPANHGGATVVQGGSLDLRGAGGALTGTSAIQLRGGQLYVNNGEAANADRLPNSAPISLGGGTLRVAGTEATLGTVSAVSGYTGVGYSMASQTAAIPLTLTGFTRTPGATVNFFADNGTLGGTTNAQGIVNPRIVLPGQADVTGINIIPWAFSTNEFIQYVNATDAGVPRGVTVLGNNGATGYNNDPAETTWTNAIINRLTGNNVTTTMTASRVLQAIKSDGSAPGTGATNRRIDFAGNGLRVQSGAIIHVGNNVDFGNSSGTTSTLTAGAVGSPAELVFQSNAGALRIGPQPSTDTSPLTGQVAIVDNDAAGPVTVVKSGPGTVQIRNTTAASTYTGGTYVNAGTLEVFRGNSLGASTGAVRLAGGTLLLNIADAGTNVSLPGLGHDVSVLANSQLFLNNVGEAAVGTDNDAVMGALTITGPYTLGLQGAGSTDVSFTGVTLSGTPTFNFTDPGAGGANHTTTIAGAVTGTGGFYINGGTNAGTLEFTGGANTYAGPLTLNGGTLRLAKAADVTAVTADANPATFDLVVNGGTLNQAAANQIDDDANVLVNNGVFFLGQANNETVASIVVNGGTAATGTAAAPGPQMRVTGDVTVRGTNNGNGGLIVDNLTTLTIDGTLFITDYGRASVREGAAAGPTATALIVNNINLTGTSLALVTGGNATRVRLNGAVTSNASALPARIDGQNDSDTYLELNGVRAFNVADGAATEDLIVGAILINSTSPAATGGVVKNGPGLMALSNTNAAGSTFTGTTTVNEGTLDLNRPAGTNAIGAGGLTVGDGAGGPGADRVRLRASNQIPDAATLAIAGSGAFDLEFANRSEVVASVTGNGLVLVGPNSVFGTANPGAGTTTFAGAIRGAGGYAKTGTGTQEFTGASDYTGPNTITAGTLLINNAVGSALGFGSVAVSGTGTLAGAGTILNTPGSPVAINTGGKIAPGNSVGTITTGDQVWAGGGTYAFEISDADLVGTPGTNWDLVEIGDGVLDVTATPTSAATRFTIAITRIGAAVGANYPAVGPDWVTIAHAGTVNNFGATDFTITDTGGQSWAIQVVPDSTPIDGGFDVQIQVVPEPASLAVAGLAGAGLLGRRRRRAIV